MLKTVNPSGWGGLLLWVWNHKRPLHSPGLGGSAPLQPLASFPPQHSLHCLWRSGSTIPRDQPRPRQHKSPEEGCLLGAWQPLLPASHKAAAANIGAWLSSGMGEVNTQEPQDAFTPSYHSPLSPTFLHNLGVSEKKTVFPALPYLPGAQAQASQHVSFSTGSSLPVGEGSGLLDWEPGSAAGGKGGSFPAHHESQVWNFLLPVKPQQTWSSRERCLA